MLKSYRNVSVYENEILRSHLLNVYTFYSI